MYNSTNVNFWSITGGTILSGQGNNTVTIRWDGGTTSGTLTVETTTGEARAIFMLNVTIALPTSPSVSDVYVCQGETVTLNAGQNVNWYASSSGGSVLDTGTTYTINNIISTQVLYVSNGVSGGCESPRVSMSAIVRQLDPGTVNTPNQVICAHETPNVLTASAATFNDLGFTYQWQHATDGINFTDIANHATGSSYQPPSNLTTDTWYRRKAIGAGCSNPEEYTNAVRVSVISAPPPVTSGGANSCSNPNSVTLTATSANILQGQAVSHRWYTSSSGGGYINGTEVPDGTTAVYQTSVTVTQATNYWVSAVIDGCESDRTPVSATFVSNTTPHLSVHAISPALCSPAAFTLSAAGGSSGSVYEWYDENGTLLATGSTYSPTVNYSDTNNGQKTFYVGGTLTSPLGCPFTITTLEPITVTVYPEPSLPTAQDRALCSPGVTTLTAGGVSGAIYKWYDSNGTYLATGSSYTTGHLSATTNYQVAAEVNGCSSGLKTVQVKLSGTPNAPQASDGANSCNSPNSVTLTAVSTGLQSNQTVSHRWYSSPTGISYVNGTEVPVSSSVYQTSVTVTQATNYWVSVVVDGCESDRTPVSATFVSNATPHLSIHAPSQASCSPTTFTLSASGGSSGSVYEWYDENGTLLATGSTYSPTVDYNGTNNGQKTFYVGGTLTSPLGCPFPVNPLEQVTVSVHPPVFQGLVQGGQSICYNTVPPLMRGVGAAGGDGSYTYQWQRRPVGGSWGNIAGATDTVYQEPSALTASMQYRRIVASCGIPDTSNVVTVTVHPELTGGTISGTQSVCGNAQPVALENVSAASGGDTHYSYQWQERPVGGSWVNISGETGTGFAPSDLTVSMEYRRMASSCMDTAYSNEVTVTVGPLVQAGVVVGSQSIAPGGQPFPLTSLVDGTYSGSYSYQWQQATDSVHFTDIAGATGTYYPLASAPATDTWYRRNIMVACGPVSSNVLKVAILPSTGDSRITPSTGTGPVSPTVPIHPAPGAYADSSKANYVRSWEVMKPGMTEAGVLTGANVEVQMATQYMDGLGRPIQTVTRGSSPDGHDLVTATFYDAYGRAGHQYLPYRSPGSNGSLKNSPFSEQKTFYDAHFGGQESVYYGHSQFDNSPLNRVVKQTAPGNSWTGHDVGVATDWQASALEDDIKKWTVNSTGLPSLAGVYPARELMVTVTTDEAGNHMREYTKKTGQVILKRVQHTGTALGHADWLNTYYIYDGFGNLRFVLPPKAVEQLHLNNWDWTGANIGDLVFTYTYDGRNRMVTKQVPGAGRVDMVYDKLDRLVLTQDANQRPLAQWTFTKYDDLGRPVMTGFYHNSGTRSSLQASLDAWTGSFGMQPDPNAGTAPYEGYTDATFPALAAGTEVLTVNYYDDYRFTDRIYHTGYNGLTGGLHGVDPAPYDNTQGLSTGSKVKVLGANQWLVTVLYYDDRGRVVQTQSSNHQEGEDITTTQYDFSGKVLKTYTLHTNPQASNTTRSLKEFTYDHAGRLLSIRERLNDTGEFKTIVTNTYNELGELETKNPGGWCGNAELHLQHPWLAEEHQWGLCGRQCQWPLFWDGPFL